MLSKLPETKEGIKEDFKSLNLKWILKGGVRWAKKKSVFSWKSRVHREPGHESPALPVSVSLHVVLPTDIPAHNMLSHKPFSSLIIISSPSISQLTPTQSLKILFQKASPYCQHPSGSFSSSPPLFPDNISSQVSSCLPWMSLLGA